MARLLTLEQIAHKRGCPIWFETHNGKVYGGWVLVYDIHSARLNPGTRIGLTQPSGHIMWMLADWYGSRWRCWDTYPTKGETEDMQWRQKHGI